jgi:ABC-type transport system involved in multi-copper enzyme maturation permease subunit
MRPVNPVLRRELVERWRSRRAPITLTIYLAVLGGIMYALYRMGTAILGSGFGFGFDASTSGPVLGRFLVEGLLFFVLLLVLFVGPGYAAAQISGERERRTLTLLQVTLLRPFQIVLGKLGASTAWLSLLIVAAVPLGAVAFFLGGIGIADLLRGLLMLILIAVCVAAMGLGISSLTKGTTGAIVLTYGAVLALTLGTFFAAGVEAVLRSVNGQELRTPVALYLNPFFGLADAVNASRISMGGPGSLPSPLGLIAETLPGSPAMNGFDNGAMIEGGTAEAVEIAPAMPVRGPRPLRADVLRKGKLRGREVRLTVDGPNRKERQIRRVRLRPAPMPVPAPGPPPDMVLAQPEIREEGRQPVWLIVLALYMLLGALGLLVATRRMRITEPRGRVSAAPAGAGPPPGVPPPPGAPGAPPGAGGWEPAR